MCFGREEAEAESERRVWGIFRDRGRRAAQGGR